MLADYHLHTRFSDDSAYPMGQVVQDALALGLEELCFTDHVDYGIKTDWDAPGPMAWREGAPLANVDYPRYFARIRQLQEQWQGKITLRAGLELGVQRHTIPLYEALVKRYPLDFGILSIHQVEDREFWNQEFQQGKSQEEYNRRYYEELLQVVEQYKEYSVVGHLDLIVRYDRAGVYPPENLRPLVEAILKQVIRDGKGIEVNTSSCRYGLRDTTPSQTILQWYRALGGRIVTIGSDSHRPGELGAGIAQSQAMLRELGFTEFCTFQNRKPIFHPL